MPEQEPLFNVEQPEEGPIVHHEESRSAVMYRLGGRMYPLKRVGQCKTCNHPMRSEIEQYVLNGYSYAFIERQLPEDNSISARAIADHVKRGHLPTSVAVRRAAVEQRAQEIGASISNHEGALVDQVTFARELVQQAYERLVNGKARVNMKDAVEAAKMLTALGMHEGSEVDQEAWQEALFAYMESTSQVVTPEQMRAIGALIRDHPTLRAAFERLQNDEVIEVEAREIEPESSAP